MLAVRLGGVSHLHGGGQPPVCGGGGRPPTVRGIGSLQRESTFIDPCVAKIEFRKAGEIEDITKKVKGIASCEFLKEKSLAEYNLESGTHKYSKCQTPPHMKKTSCF